MNASSTPPTCASSGNISASERMIGIPVRWYSASAAWRYGSSCVRSFA